MGKRDGGDRGDRDVDGVRGDRTDARGYGDGWPKLRERTLRRDGYACTRCGCDDRTLQAHHVIPRSAGGPDALENLLTLCRPCHGVIHQSNGSFDDVRDDAPLFPKPDAPDPVARMREPDDQLCSRCGTERVDPANLVAWTDVPRRETRRNRNHLTVCTPCAGLLLEEHRGCTMEALESNRRLGRSELGRHKSDAPVRPSAFAPSQVAIRREPRTRRERLIDDTALRFLCNHRGVRWAILIAVAFALFSAGMASL
ncbi:HNH endonuclease [Natrarchaeobius oligotrophus]|uniref:HNH endonuclease n=1 Tax=Natrarchaeobius chitinivorans TaxID=1679083 RepID=A0A3N6PMR8_NATCH|nr:HNH endonuclease [Natrarchaeobius chitinivorans]RQH00336.1 HNH endonuclease [Natrarchaeobius chitinivorans]